MYADAIEGLLRSSVSSVRVLNDILKVDGNMSGYKVNQKKAIFMDSHTSSMLKEQIGLINIVQWKDRKIRYLGIFLSKKCWRLCPK